MVFHWSMSDSKTPHLSRTLLNILANLNNTAVWMVLACPLISNPSSLLSRPLGIFLMRQLKLVSLSSSCSIAFLVLWQGPSTSLSFCFLWFLLWFACTAKSTIQQVLFVLIIITRSGYYYYFIFLVFFKFFMPAKAGDLSLELKWQ